MSETGDMLDVEAWCTGGCNTFTTGYPCCQGGSA